LFLPADPQTRSCRCGLGPLPGQGMEGRYFMSVRNFGIPLLPHG